MNMKRIIVTLVTTGLLLLTASSPVLADMVRLVNSSVDLIVMLA